jgi:ribosomal protein L4
MSYKIDIFNHKGDKVNVVDLDQTVFAEANVNNDLMYQFVRMQQANARVVIASTKNR